MDNFKPHIKPSETHFISLEGAELYGLPLYDVRLSNNQVVKCARVDGKWYRVKKTWVATSEPIPYLKSGRAKK